MIKMILALFVGLFIGIMSCSKTEKNDGSSQTEKLDSKPVGKFLKNKVGFKGIYLDDNIETACNAIKDLIPQMQNPEYPNIKLRYVENASKDVCFITSDDSNNPSIDYSFVNVKSNNKIVNEINFKNMNSSFLNSVLNPQKLNSSAFAQLLLDSLPWLKTLKPFSGKVLVDYNRSIYTEKIVGYQEINAQLGYMFTLGMDSVSTPPTEINLRKVENTFK